MDSASQFFIRRIAALERPLQSSSEDPSRDHPFYCLIETSGFNAEHDLAKFETFLEHVMSEGIVSDGVLAQDETQAQKLWRWREGITEAIGHYGGTYKYDFSIPIPEWYSLVEETRQRLTSLDLMASDDPSDTANSARPAALGVVGYGHLGDSNLHLNVPVRSYSKAIEEALEPWVFEWIQAHNGSISAEHGLGFAKTRYLQYSRSEEMVRLMREKVKDVWDPRGIMNPYKYV